MTALDHHDGAIQEGDHQKRVRFALGALLAVMFALFVATFWMLKAKAAGAF
jgi:hypothetical protein